MEWIIRFYRAESPTTPYIPLGTAPGDEAAHESIADAIEWWHDQTDHDIMMVDPAIVRVELIAVHDGGTATPGEPSGHLVETSARAEHD